jgi:hypothetical protein
MSAFFFSRRQRFADGACGLHELCVVAGIGLVFGARLRDDLER